MTDSHILKSDATSAPVMDWADLGLNERLRSMVEDRGWQPTPIQAAAFQDVSTDHDRVLIAPTGSGKTQAVMLPLVHRILEEGLPPLSAIYVTPLRALNRDVERRMAQFVEEAGLTVASRYGIRASRVEPAGQTPTTSAGDHPRDVPAVVHWSSPAPCWPMSGW